MRFTPFLKLRVFASLVLTLGIARIAEASTPTSAISLVENVTVTKGDPQTVVIEGKFVLVVDPKIPSYSSPQSGYLYYACPKGQESLCDLAWTDIKKSIGTGNCAMFGTLTTAPGTIRAMGTPLANPDTYDVGIGVTVTPFALGKCDEIKAFNAVDGGVVSDDAVSANDAGVTADGAVTQQDQGVPIKDSGAKPTADATSTGNDAGGNKPSSNGCALGSTLGCGELFILLMGFVVLRRRMARSH